MKTEFFSSSIRCGGCAANVRAVLGRAEGVRTVEVDPVTKRVEVEFDDARISVDDLSQKLSDAGYPAEPRSA